MLVQAVCLAFLFAVRPIKMKKDSIINFMNEIEFFLLAGLLIKYNQKSDWNNLIQRIFTGIISGTNLIILFISIGKTSLRSIAFI